MSQRLRRKPKGNKKEPKKKKGKEELKESTKRKKGPETNKGWGVRSNMSHTRVGNHGAIPSKKILTKDHRKGKK